MREYKFRTWHKELKYMSYNAQNESCLYLTLKDNNLDVMQYTEIKDIKGIEVYEGDIVKAKCSRGEIIFEDGCFIIKWIRDKDFFNNVLSRHADCIAIVGNIYETPLLVE